MATEKKNLNKLTKNLGKYLDQDQLEQVKKAYFFAANAHSGQFRVSGDPYVTHPLAVAEILGTLKMDQDCLSAAMLHDVIEDSGIPKTFLKKEFNKEVANLVDGVSKLDKVELTSKKDLQAESFQKMVLAMSEDIRVIVVKLADRLHNMRTIKFLNKEKKLRIANETIEIYAPIAHRLGMHQIYRELEDLAFEILYPLRFRVIEEAELNSISVVRSPLLARALFYTGSIGLSISEQLYSAVASILAYVYQLERGVNTVLQEPEIPSEFIFDEFGKPVKEKIIETP